MLGGPFGVENFIGVPMDVDHFILFCPGLHSTLLLDER